MENIMLDENKKSIKIVDFGLSNTFTMDELMKTHCGSPEYAAPELFSAGEKYGPEVDIWAIGIIIYAMLVGKLPFTTVYTDQYRRIKLLKQIEKGIQQEQEQEMLHLTQECRDLIRSIIEPKPDIRLPMLDIEIHPWITEGSKVPFFPFVAMPRDKSLKSQVIDELSSALSMKKEQIETTVHENKSDEISAMFNMLLHKKRIESGII
ncbi:hypothetical protein SNE40_011167 [Patella caerulea]|uniref:Protein kinase domain-containing protein n=1 Tax=Patella caerulea TaxID=87958 RepID=A0AAN8JJG6_PATCE